MLASHVLSFYKNYGSLACIDEIIWGSFSLNCVSVLNKCSQNYAWDNSKDNPQRLVHSFQFLCSTFYNLTAQIMRRQPTPINHSADSECDLCCHASKIHVRKHVDGRQNVPSSLHISAYFRFRDTFAYTTV